MDRFHHKYTLPAILTLLVVVIAALLIGLLNLKKQTTLPLNTNASAVGIELNQDVDYVDLHKLQANGVSFVYLKSTQGRSYFDDNYLSYRDQILGTKLAFGTIISYSNESTPLEHYRYFTKMVGQDTGSLPIMLVPAVDSRSKSYLEQMGQFAQMLQQAGKQVIVAVNYKYRGYFAKSTKFISFANRRPDRVEYAFWRYTTNGRVKNIRGLENNVTMFSYNGTVTQYKQKYGQLTQ
ncbi:GH25 family lysozyme [Lactobacillus sp. ESL0791]|uniref:GH25 family lysozyme n=1 Tax=Lactobacillus sp. ESL0791 TaxID=2983234 RepID=UPI0023F72CF3|nr:GH25 family lysozyme [Lactobacillus sp. ESL0791]MDF7639214.1 GH25 family lysozyme [Lactobacillus sp. ESL0791]